MNEIIIIFTDYRQGGKACETCQSPEDNEDIQISETLCRPTVPHLHIAPGTKCQSQHTLSMVHSMLYAPLVEK